MERKKEEGKGEWREEDSLLTNLQKTLLEMLLIYSLIKSPNKWALNF